MESASFENSARSENELFRSENGGDVLANSALKRILGSKRGTKTKLNLITVQQDATYSVYYISVGSSTCFRR